MNPLLPQINRTTSHSRTTHTLTLAPTVSQANGAADAATELTAESVKLRVAELFPAGATAPAVKPRLPPVAATPTGKLACLSFDAAKTVKLTRGKLAREEAASYILADLLGIELLPGEAMRLGHLWYTATTVH